MDPYQDTAELNTMLDRDRRSAAQKRDAAQARITAAAGADALPQVTQEAASTIDYFTGRHDAHDFVLEDLEGAHHPDELMSFLDQGLIDYIANADSLQKVKGFSAVVNEINDFRLSC